MKTRARERWESRARPRMNIFRLSFLCLSLVRPFLFGGTGLEKIREEKIKEPYPYGRSNMWHTLAFTSMYITYCELRICENAYF